MFEGEGSGLNRAEGLPATQISFEEKRLLCNGT